MMSKSIKNIMIFATSYLPLTGGAQVAVDEITRRLPQYRFILFCPRLKNLPTRETIRSVEIYRLGFGFSIDKFLFPLLGPLAALFTQGRQCLIWAIMANFGGFGALVYHWLTFKRNPFLLTLQEGVTIDYMKKHSGPLFPLIKLLIRSATAIQAISTFLLDLAGELGATTKLKWVVPNGVDLNLFKPQTDSPKKAQLRTSLGFQESDKVLFSASRLSEKNAIGPTIEALALLPGYYKFLIAGDGELEKKLKALVASLGLNTRVRFLGKVPQDKIVEYLSISHIFIRPSIREGLGISFLEAMAANVPVVASLAGGLKDFIIDNETGMVADPFNISSISKAILAYNNDKVYQRIQEKGRLLAINNFDWDPIGEKMSLIFNTLSETKA